MHPSAEQLCFAWQHDAPTGEHAVFYFYPDGVFVVEAEGQRDGEGQARPGMIVVGTWELEGDVLVTIAAPVNGPFADRSTGLKEKRSCPIEMADESHLNLRDEELPIELKKAGALPDRKTKPRWKLEPLEDYRAAGLVYDLRFRVVGDAVPKRVNVHPPSEWDAYKTVLLKNGAASLPVFQPGVYHIRVPQMNNFSRLIGSITVPQSEEAVIECDEAVVLITIARVPPEFAGRDAMAYLASEDRKNRSGHQIEIGSPNTEIEIETTRIPRLFLDHYRRLVVVIEDQPEAFQWEIQPLSEQSIHLDFQDATPCEPIKRASMRDWPRAPWTEEDRKTIREKMKKEMEDLQSGR
jgi:hypothetical protein